MSPEDFEKLRRPTHTKNEAILSHFRYYERQLADLWHEYERNRQVLAFEFRQELYRLLDEQPDHETEHETDEADDGSHVWKMAINTVEQSEDLKTEPLPETLLGLPVVLTESVSEGEIKLGSFTFSHELTKPEQVENPVYTKMSEFEEKARQICEQLSQCDDVYDALVEYELLSNLFEFKVYMAKLGPGQAVIIPIQPASLADDAFDAAGYILHVAEIHLQAIKQDYDSRETLYLSVTEKVLGYDDLSVTGTPPQKTNIDTDPPNKPSEGDRLMKFFKGESDW